MDTEAANFEGEDLRRAGIHQRRLPCGVRANRLHGIDTGIFPRTSLRSIRVLLLQHDPPPEQLQQSGQGEESRDPKARSLWAATTHLHCSEHHGEDAAQAHAEAQCLRANRWKGDHEGPVGRRGHATYAATQYHACQERDAVFVDNNVPHEGATDQRKSAHRLVGVRKRNGKCSHQHSRDPCRTRDQQEGVTHLGHECELVAELFRSRQPRNE
mmetsp:Transcript_163062/g.517984  ORF Transcript_163062/g.517984 Transcript_163062/m.517984 type:complete len:213 (-) Transcript_163062:368-1006(-)